MPSLQRSASWLFAFLLGLSVLATPANAPAQMIYPDSRGPAKGAFDWKKFEGRYELGECHSRPSAIWGDGTPDTFVQIDYKVHHSSNPTTQGLELMRASNRSPIALGWSIERIGNGRHTEKDRDTDHVGKVMESYTTADGIYAMLAWDRPYNVGWSTLQLRIDSHDRISLTIRQRRDSDVSTAEETCMLHKYAPKFPG